MTPPDKSSILQHRKEGRTAGRFDKARLVRTREMLDADATRFRYPDQPRPDETSPVQPASIVVVVVVLAGESPIDPPLPRKENRLGPPRLIHDLPPLARKVQAFEVGAPHKHDVDQVGRVDVGGFFHRGEDAERSRQVRQECVGEGGAFERGQGGGSGFEDGNEVRFGRGDAVVQGQAEVFQLGSERDQSLRDRLGCEGARDRRQRDGRERVEVRGGEGREEVVQGGTAARRQVVRDEGFEALEGELDGRGRSRDEPSLEDELAEVCPLKRVNVPCSPSRERKRDARLRFGCCSTAGSKSRVGAAIMSICS